MNISDIPTVDYSYLEVRSRVENYADDIPVRSGSSLSLQDLISFWEIFLRSVVDQQNCILGRVGVYTSNKLLFTPRALTHIFPITEGL